MNKQLIKIREMILKDKEILEFIETNNIPNEVIDNNLSIFLQQKYNNDLSKACKGQKTCAIEDDGIHTKLDYHNGRITLKHIPCPYIDHLNDELLDLMFFPDQFQDGELDETRINRKEVYKRLNIFMQDPLNNKGLYIHGPFGTGKTFILYKTAKQLSDKGFSVTFAYYPDLVRHIKSSITTTGTEPIVNKLKQVDVLMLDDVGGENNTSYIRDEILGPVLQYRMLGNKPTFMTSNADIKLLREHFRETKDSVDSLKADRIIERIEYMMDVVEIRDLNLRRI